LLWAFYAPHRQEVRSLLNILFTIADARNREKPTLLHRTNRELWKLQTTEGKSFDLPRITRQTRLECQRFMQLEGNHHLVPDPNAGSANLGGDYETL
jgi:hypothetical protein